MELRVLLQVIGLEVVRPEDPEVVLHQIRPLLLDEHRSRFEVRVLGPGVLLHAGLDGLGFDAGLGRVVDPAGEIAVGVDRSRGVRPVEECENEGRDTHAEAPCSRQLQVRGTATLSRVSRP